MRRRAFRQGVLMVGLAGSFVFVLAGTWMLISRVWYRSFTQTLEVGVASPFIAVWVLAPVLWAAWPGSEPTPSEDEPLAPLLSAVLLVVVGAGAYGWEFVLRPAVFNVELDWSSLVFVLVVPLIQWTILGIAGVVQLVLDRSQDARGSDP